MANIHCLGTGLVGSYVAKKLADMGHKINAYDIRPEKSIIGYRNIIIHQEDALDNCRNIEKFGDFDIIVNMLPGDIGYSAMKMLCEQDIKVVDLSFSEVTPDIVMENCENKQASVLWDVGIAPGLSNMLLSLAHRELGKLKNGEIRVGGNPTKQTEGWNYMAPFSPNDVIAEYTRPARVVRDSKIVTLEALSERHMIEVSGRGEMEAFLTDGLRSVLDSIPASDMSEYTVRWPGHIQKYIDERKSNLINYEELVEEWKYNPQISEFTWMEVMALGNNDVKMRWIITDEGKEDGHSMARCTGLVTVFCIDEWLNNPNMIGKGVYAPEYLKTDVINRIIEKMRLERIYINLEITKQSA